MHTPILPFHFRLVSLVRLPGAAGREVMNEAVLYHKDAQITACWTSRHVDIRLKRGCCVALRGACFHQLRNGCLPVSRLELIDKSCTPRFFSSVTTCNQNLAPSVCAIHRPSTSFSPAMLMPMAR